MMSLLLQPDIRRHRHFFYPVMTDLRHLKFRSLTTMREEWVWLTWKRKFNDKTCSKDYPLKIISRNVKAIPMWTPRQMQSFHLMKTDLCCKLIPWRNR